MNNQLWQYSKLTEIQKRYLLIKADGNSVFKSEEEYPLNFYLVHLDLL